MLAGGFAVTRYPERVVVFQPPTFLWVWGADAHGELGDLSDQSKVLPHLNDAAFPPPARCSRVSLLARGLPTSPDLIAWRWTGTGTCGPGATTATAKLVTAAVRTYLRRCGSVREGKLPPALSSSAASPRWRPEDSIASPSTSSAMYGRGDITSSGNWAATPRSPLFRSGMSRCSPRSTSTADHRSWPSRRVTTTALPSTAVVACGC